MFYDVIIVGGGIAGLTSAAFLAKSGYSILLLEKTGKVGGCINSFERDGFIFDGGIRAIENSGVLLPMLRRLGIDVELVKNNISIGLGKDVIRLESVASLVDYEMLLQNHFPDNSSDIEKIFVEIKNIINYMNVLYGIDNPLFLDMKKHRKYVIKVILPWLFRYLFTIRKIEKLREPVKQYLARFSTNQSLIEVIAQHFFKDTPTFFALGYFQLYLDYYYPRGGTQTLPDKIKDFISNGGVQIQNNTEIKVVNPEQHQLLDQNGDCYSYGKLIWAADLKTLYNIIDIDAIEDSRTKMDISFRKKELADKTGGDSIFTLYLGLDLDKQYFADIATEHFFYTPFSRGLLESAAIDLSSKEAAVKSLGEFFRYNTYEISCPVLRDNNLAPPGKTGLIVSTLFDYSVTEAIDRSGWYDEFKIHSEAIIIDLLNDTIYPGIRDKIICQFSATPRTFFEKFGNSEGAITGWGFNNRDIPVETRLIKIANAIKTPNRDIFQAGQWAFSPSGVPVSIITGKLAADRVRKNM